MSLRLFTIETCKTFKRSLLWIGLAVFLFLFEMFMLVNHRRTTNGLGYTQFINILLPNIFSARVEGTYHD
jgi:hypothetical protein